MAWSFSSTVARISSSLVALSSLSVFEAGFDGGAELILMGGVAAHELDELGVEGFAVVRVLLAGFVLEVGEALRDGVDLMLDVVAEGGGGGCVVVAEALEIVLEGMAEGGDVADDFGAEVAAECGAVLAGAAGLVGDGCDCSFIGELV